MSDTEHDMWREHYEAVCSLMFERNVMIIHSSELPKAVAGRYKITTNTIEIARGFSAYEELTTLIHEAGHALGAKERYYAKKGNNGCKRAEWQAYAWGWPLIKQLNIPISREMWRAQCRQDWQCHVRYEALLRRARWLLNQRCYCGRSRFASRWYINPAHDTDSEPTLGEFDV